MNTTDATIPPHPRPPRKRDQGEELDHRGGGANADEQPRRRGRRGPAEPRRLRRHRPRRAQLGNAYDKIVETLERLEEDQTLLVQSGKPVGVFRDAQGRAARAHRQLQPRAQMGELGDVQRARSQGAHDVRPDDGRQLDLHRHAGHRPRHLRDLRRDGPPALWRRPQGQVDPDRRPWRNGRRAAARGGHGRRPLHRHRGARKAGSRSGSRRATSTGARPASTRRWRSSARRPSRPASACSAMLPRSSRKCSRAAFGPTRSPTRPARTIRPTAIARPAGASPSGRRCASAILPRSLHAARNLDRPPRRGDAGLQGHGRADLRLWQQHPPGSLRHGRHPRLRLSGLRSGLCPPALLPRHRPVPLGRAVAAIPRTSTAPTRR